MQKRKLIIGFMGWFSEFLFSLILDVGVGAFSLSNFLRIWDLKKSFKFLGMNTSMAIERAYIRGTIMKPVEKKIKKKVEFEAKIRWQWHRPCRLFVPFSYLFLAFCFRNLIFFTCQNKWNMFVWSEISFHYFSSKYLFVLLNIKP